MKRLIDLTFRYVLPVISISILLIILSGCDPISDTVEPEYQSIEGKWESNSDLFKANIEIVDYAGTLTIDNGKGNTFTVGGKTYQITDKTTIKWDPPNKFQIHLISGQFYVDIYNIDYNKEFTELRSDLWGWGEGSVTFNQTEEILFTR